jgi:toxin ParE1/3/4
LKKYRLIVTDTAKADLRSIYDFIAQESPQAAERFTKDLATELHRLAIQGMTGSPRDWISPGLRGHPYRKRCFYFRVVEDKLFVIRVLHAQHDVDAQEFPES